MPREYGVIGLGRMGGNIARLSLERGMRVVAFGRHDPKPDLVAAGIVDIRDYKDFRSQLAAPRIVFLYIPAGPTVDRIMEQLAEVLEPRDVIVDGGNSYWGDSIRREERLGKEGLGLVDLGTSGGEEGARSGPCYMAGGRREIVALVEPILKDLCIEGGYVHAGGPGSGHFVKLVHNGIEFGMLQAIGEGLALLERYHEPLPVADVLGCWRHGSVVRSWLVDLLEQQYRERGGVKDITTYIEDTGEVNWLVSDALRMEVPVPVITQSVVQLLASRDRQQDWARAVVSMRHSFGGHPLGPDDTVAQERKEGRVGNIWQPSREKN